MKRLCSKDFVILKNLFNDKNKNRTNIVKKNILLNAIIKGMSVIISFLMVKVTYQYLGNNEIYGAWLTILSVLTWINLFDLGLGNGLRNRLAEMISAQNFNKGKIYVSTGYFVVLSIVIILTLLFLVISPLLEWNRIFNLSINSTDLDKTVTLIIISYFFIFLFSLINSISYAHQDSVLPGVLSLLSNTLIIIFIYILEKVNYSSLFTLGFLYSSITLLVLVVANIYLFSKKYRLVRPSLNCINFSYIKSLFNIGLKFFIIQIMSIVIFSTDNIIITQLLGPKYVTEYQIAYKLLSIYTILSSLIMTPLWSAYTDAYIKNDYVWIKRTLKNLMLLMIPFILFIVITIVFADIIIKIWMGESFFIHKSLLIMMGIYITLTIWSSIFAYLLNGINKPNVQLISLIIGGIINIPLSIYFSRDLNLGNSGVVLGTICALMIFAIAGPLQVYFEFYSKKSKEQNV